MFTKRDYGLYLPVERKKSTRATQTMLVQLGESHGGHGAALRVTSRDGSHAPCRMTRIRLGGAGPVHIVVKITHRLGIEYRYVQTKGSVSRIIWRIVVRRQHTMEQVVATAPKRCPDTSSESNYAGIFILKTI